MYRMKVWNAYTDDDEYDLMLDLEGPGGESADVWCEECEDGYIECEVADTVGDIPRLTQGVVFGVVTLDIQRGDVIEFHDEGYPTIKRGDEVISRGAHA